VTQTVFSLSLSLSLSLCRDPGETCARCTWLVTFSSWRLEVQRRQRSLDLSGARARARPRVKDVDQSARITCAPAFPQIGRFGGSGLEYDIAPVSSDMAATTRLFLLSLLLFVGSSHAVPGRLSGTWTRFSGSPLSGILAVPRSI